MHAKARLSVWSLTASRRGVRLVLLAGWSGLIAATGVAADWYVAPDGTPEGKGTRQAPWDIASALAGRQSVQPGDTVHLLGGTYRRRPQEQFEVKLVGTAQAPVHVRPAAGQRATIDGGLAVQPP